MPERTLAEWLTDIEARHPKEIELGLDRVALVWERLQLRVQSSAEPARQTILVAGTNGKGSCVATMESVLLAHGHAVGAFTSPHFLRYNERIRINGQPVPDDHIIAAFELIETTRENVRLTYFEFNALAALVIFRQSALDAVVLEVGLGGRLDAVNIVDADVAILTSVDLDHQEWLGDTRSQIAREKLGIARPNRPLIVGEQDPPDSFDRMVLNIGAKSLCLNRDFNYSPGSDRGRFNLELVGEFETAYFSDLPCGSLLPSNISSALQALYAAGFALDEVRCREALCSIRLTGRCQTVFYKDTLIVLDVAHNPAAAEVLASFLTPISGNTFAVASALADKDWKNIVSKLDDVVDHWFVGQITDNPRAMDARSLLEVVYNAGSSGEYTCSVESAFAEAINRCSKEDRVVVFGSFSVVSAVLAVMEKED
jgi:dihydrofolate synthase/folylpolyglutamate synthase